MWQAITWTDDGLVYWCTYVSLGLNELTYNMVNSLGLDDIIWHHRIYSTLLQAMACCLTALSHYLHKTNVNTLRPRQNGCHWQTTFSNAFSWMKIYEFRLRFHWNLFLRVQLTIFQHWFRWWLGADQAASHYLNQWWLDYRCIYASPGLNELSYHQCRMRVIFKEMLKILCSKWMSHICFGKSVYGLITGPLFTKR